MTQEEFKKAVQNIMEATGKALEEAKTENEKVSILKAQNSAIQGVLERLA